MRDSVSIRMPRHLVNIGTIVSIVGCGVLLAASALQADWKGDVGYTDLINALTAKGIAVPTGSGVIVTQVEAGGSNHRPNSSNSEFTYPPLAKSFVYKTTSYTGVSDHATVVGQLFYGNSLSIAPGVGTVNVWEADDWINHSLKRGTSIAPAAESADVANFSWIGSYDNDTVDTEVLRRLDYSINRDDYVAVVGVNNGSSTTLPKLLCQSYNAISVGITGGAHSHGVTTINGAGRMKPDIVAPGLYNGSVSFYNGTVYTSWATAMVSSASAMLLETAKGSPAYSNATHSETMKAMLMAGATKSEFTNWSNTHTSPLDSTYGAGELNVNRSYHIFTGGEQESSTSQLISGSGWDFDQSAASGNEKLYFFDVPAGTTLSELSAVLTWNAIVTPSNFSLTLADLDLNLWSASDFTTLSKLNWSASTVDNVEHLYLTDLAAGRYAIGVTSNTFGVDYALAWYAVPEPGTFLMLASCLALGLVYLGARRVSRARSRLSG